MENDAAMINQLEDTAKQHVRMLQYHIRTHVLSLSAGVRDTAPTLLTTNVQQTLGYGIGWAKDQLWSLAVGNQSRDRHVYKLLAMSGLTTEETVNDVLALAVLATAELSMSELLLLHLLILPNRNSLCACCQLLPRARQRAIQEEGCGGGSEWFA